MEKIRRNENCIVGLPRCDYVFNSTRSSFIAYGFKESKLETDVLTSLLKDFNIEVFEAGSDLEPGKNAFCTKICSKIITSQFCIVLLNNDTKDGVKIPNANVNMEYGLMLGFNKYVIPFQRESEQLPFNVAGLDTIKYNSKNFKEKAQKAIQKAIDQTKPKLETILPIDKIIDTFLLIKDALVCPIDDVGTKNIYNLGSPFGYYLLNDYAGLKYYYLGIFNTLTIDQIKWKINKLEQILISRFSKEALSMKVEFGIIDANGLINTLKLVKMLEAWIIVQTDSEKEILDNFIGTRKIPFTIFSFEKIRNEVENVK